MTVFSCRKTVYFQSREPRAITLHMNQNLVCKRKRWEWIEGSFIHYYFDNNVELFLSASFGVLQKPLSYIFLELLLYIKHIQVVSLDLLMLNQDEVLVLSNLVSFRKAHQVVVLQRLKKVPLLSTKICITKSNI